MPIRSIRRAAAASSFAFALALFLAPSADAQDTVTRRTPDPAKASGTRGAGSRAAKPKRTTKTKRTAAHPDSARPAKPAEPEPEWPVKGPAPLAGSILPGKRIVAFYGNPLSKRMGVLGEYPVDVMLAKLDREVAAWTKADPSTPVQPALHLIAVTAQGAPGKDGKYRLRMDSTLIEKVYGWAQRRHALLFLDIQVGQSTLQEELPRLTPFFRRPDVHLGVDPEFSMHYAAEGRVPGKKIGTFDAADINYASSFLASLVTQYRLPPKVLVVHRFTENGLRNYRSVRLDPRVQIVIHMDGWGVPSHKRDTYRRYVYKYPVQYTGFKLFFHNDTKTGTRLMKPADVLALKPKPIYVQYQ